MRRASCPPSHSTLEKSPPQERLWQVNWSFADLRDEDGQQIGGEYLLDSGSRPSPPSVSRGTKLSAGILGLFFVLAGANHFINPPAYLAMIPPYVPFPVAANVLSGAGEMAAGIALFIPGLRRAGGWGLIVLLLAVFPANIHMALHGLEGERIAPWIFWARLPLQFVLIAWIYCSCIRPRRPSLSNYESFAAHPTDAMPLDAKRTR